MCINNYMNYNINVEDFQIWKQMLCFDKNSDIITSYDPILVDKSMLHVNHMTIFGRNLACGSHVTPFGRKETIKSTIINHTIIVWFTDPIVTHRKFLLNTKMATVVLHHAKFHKIKVMLLLTYLLNRKNIPWQG